MSVERRALIVDDRKNWREILTRRLKKNNFNVTTASNFIDAQEKIEHEQDFDLAIFDARFVDDEIADLDGLKLLKLIKQKTPTVKTILISDYPNSFSENPEYLEKNPPDYADKFMYKAPESGTFDTEKFKQIIQQFFNPSE